MKNIDPVKLRKLIETNDKELISHSLCEVGDDIFYDRGVEAVPSALRTIVAVETFYGEVANGGLTQYLSNDHRAFAVYAVDALEDVGLPVPAKVLRSALELFPQEIKDSSEPDYFDYFETIDEEFGSDYLEKQVEREFWDWYNDGNMNEIRDRLHAWIIENEARFTKEH